MGISFDRIASAFSMVAFSIPGAVVECELFSAPPVSTNLMLGGAGAAECALDHGALREMIVALYPPSLGVVG